MFVYGICAQNIEESYVNHVNGLVWTLFNSHFRYLGASAVGWGNAPQDGRFRIRLPVGSLEIFKWPISSAHIQQPWGSLSF